MTLKIQKLTIHARLTAITRKLDNLHRVQLWKENPLEASNHIEHEMQRLSISLYPSAPPEPLRKY